MSDYPSWTRRALYLAGSDLQETGIYRELGPLSNNSKPLEIFHKVNETGIVDKVYTFDFGDGPFQITIPLENTDNFSGLEVLGDLEVSNRIYQHHVNIGFNNTAHKYSNNIGDNNIASNSDVNLELSSFNIGSTNILNESRESLNIGNNNNLQSGRLNLNLGFSNYSEKISNSQIIGNNNIISGNANGRSLNLSVFGEANNVNLALNSMILGDSNTIQSGYNNSILGDNNVEIDSVYNTVVGETNVLRNVTTSDIYGDGHTVTDSRDFILLGEGNIMSGVEGVIAIGEDSELSNNFDGITIGNNNSISNQNNVYTFGTNNYFHRAGLGNLILGKSNELSTQTGAVVVGNSNLLDSSFSNYVFGDNNLASGSSKNLIFGKNNETFTSADLDVFGSNNLSYGNTETTVIGSFNNITTGRSNLILGFDNIIDGYVNSIIIGLRTEFTGVATSDLITIANGSSSIEVGQTTVNIKGSELLYNDNEILTRNDVPSDYSKLISGSQVFSSYIINDPNYKKISNRIELQKFAYSGKEFRTNNFSFSGVNANTSEVYDFSDNFFKRRYDVDYNRSLGNFYLRSDDNKFDIIFTGAYSGSGWAIKPKDEEGFLFANKEGNRTTCPVSGWRPTGILGITGYIPTYPDHIDVFYVTGSNIKDRGAYGTYIKREDTAFDGIYWERTPKNNFEIYAPYTNTTDYYIVSGRAKGYYRSSNLRTWTRDSFGTLPVPSGSLISFEIVQQNTPFTGVSEKQELTISNTIEDLPQHFTSFYNYSTNKDISVIYGAHKNSSKPYTWMIVDKYSSGIYYVNNNYNINETPQAGWQPTGYLGYSGRNPLDLNNSIKSTGIKIVVGSSLSGLIAINDSVYGRVYIPFVY